MKYEDAGVNISAGDEASKAAYAAAKTTFSSRKGMIGQPYVLEGGFAGALDMGDYLLIQNDDGTGTKAEIAERTGIYTTLGEDLCAMVADDAVCVGAEVISLTNTYDVPFVDVAALTALSNGLAKACAEQKIVIPGGEIAEMGDAVNKLVWNATAVGVVKKEAYITGEQVKPGDAIIALKGRVLRSNGVSLARKICELRFGDDWHTVEYSETQTWGEVLLTPSKIYHRLLHDTLLGGFETPALFPIHALCHVTGGGIPGNLPRVLPTGFGAKFERLQPPHDALKQLVKAGNVDDAEAYKTWHCGNAFFIVCPKNVAQDICDTINAADSEVDAFVSGGIIEEPVIQFPSGFSDTLLTFSIE